MEAQNQTTTRRKYRTQSKSQRIRKMLEKGIPPKKIAKTLGTTPQAVYNVRYYMNKQTGLGALPKPPLTKQGIATVRRTNKRKPEREAATPIVVPKKIRPSLWERVVMFFRGY